MSGNQWNWKFKSRRNEYHRKFVFNLKNQKKISKSLIRMTIKKRWCKLPISTMKENITTDPTDIKKK